MSCTLDGNRAVNYLKYLKHLTRDLILFVVAVGSFVYEVKYGGGRASVLTACVGLLLSPALMHTDEARRTKTEDKANADADK